MIAFSGREIAYSVISALIFGAGLSVLASLMEVLGIVFQNMRNFTRDIFKFEKLTELSSVKFNKENQKKAIILRNIGIVAFTVGFILLSYFCLDGIIRIYMVILCFASFYLSKFTFSDFLRRVLIAFISLLYRCLVITLRLLLYPIILLFRRLLPRFYK